MPSYPCPNPTCNHRFAGRQVVVAADLKCPVCGQSFQFRTSAKTATKPKRQVHPPAPIAVPPKRAETLIELDGGAGPLVQPPARPRKPSLIGYVLIAMVMVAVIAAVVFGVLAYKDFAPVEIAGARKDHVIVGNVHDLSNHDELAFKLILDEKLWKPANDIRKGFAATTAWRGIDSARVGWIAVAVHDYGVTNPREADLLRRHRAVGTLFRECSRTRGEARGTSRVRGPGLASALATHLIQRSTQLRRLVGAHVYVGTSRAGLLDLRRGSD